MDLVRILRTALAETLSWTKATSHCRFRFELFGVVEFEANQHVPAHAHAFYEFGIVLKGVGELQLRRGSHGLANDSLYVVEPGVTHRVIGAAPDGLTCILFHVTPEPLDDSRMLESLPGVTETGVTKSESLNQVIRSWAALHDRQSGDSLSRSLFARLLASEMMRLMETKVGVVDSSLVERAKREIEKHLSRKIEVAQLSERLGVSERTLRRHFQKELNCSVMHYIHACRLRMAKIHLTHHLPVAEVARLVGFESGAQLSRLFRKTLGVSPKAWQKDLSPTRRLPADV